MNRFWLFKHGVFYRHVFTLYGFVAAILCLCTSFPSWSTPKIVAVPVQAELDCGGLLAGGRIAEPSASDLRSAFVGPTVQIASSEGPLELGVVDINYPGVAENVSQLLVRSISDARESNAIPGHLPDHLVDDVINQYISPEKVRSLWSDHGHRFAMMNSSGRIVGTVFIASDHRTILYVNRWNNNVPASSYPGIKPEGYHQMMNLSVQHELRREKLASLMMNVVIYNFRYLFNGKGIWMRADPPWHDKLTGLGFVHDPSMDSLLPEDSERTLGLPHFLFNQKYNCRCHSPHPEKPEALLVRADRLQREKLQYFSFTRDFEPKDSIKERSRILSDSLHRQPTQTFDYLIVGSGPVGTALALQLRKQAPASKVLIIDRGISNFAMSGHGTLYALALPPDFRFPGGIVQPLAPSGVFYPTDIEQALLANQTSMNILTDTKVDRIDSNGRVYLTSGIEVMASRIIYATGAGEPNYEVLSPSALRLANEQDHIQSFSSFARLFASSSDSPSKTGTPEKVVVLGGGAAGAAAMRLIAQNPNLFQQTAHWVREPEQVQSVDYDTTSKTFRIQAVAEGTVHVHTADRVVMALGSINRTRENLTSVFDGKTQPWENITAPDGRIIARFIHQSDSLGIYAAGAAAYWEEPAPPLNQMMGDVKNLSKILLNMPSKKETP
jgi:thioredoxin reductase